MDFQPIEEDYSISFTVEVEQKLSEQTTALTVATHSVIHRAPNAEAALLHAKNSLKRVLTMKSDQLHSRVTHIDIIPSNER